MTAERRVLDREKRQVEETLLAMHALVDQALAQVMTSIATGVAPDVEALRRGDGEINHYQHRIEEMCFLIIATQQPVASDLRAIISDTHIAQELERIGDHVVAMGSLLEAPAADEESDLRQRLHDIAERCRAMLNDAMAAYRERDEPQALAVGAADDEVDRLQDAFAEAVVPTLARSEASARRGTRLLWIDHNLERIADRATNIAERVIFMVSGRTLDLNR